MLSRETGRRGQVGAGAGQGGAGQAGAGHEGSGMMRWLLTYADLITLLMAFFVVLYSMARVDQDRYRRLAEELRAVFKGGPAVLERELTPAPRESSSGATEGEGFLDQLVEVLREYARERGLGNLLVVERAPGQVVVRLPEALLFEVGRAELGPRARVTLGELAAILARVPNPIHVEGFTDDIPIHNAFYPSNWHLSAARAASVALYLVQEGRIDPRRITAVGYGEYRPLVPNDSDHHRMLNRRVDLLILAAGPGPEGREAEPAHGEPGAGPH